MRNTVAINGTLPGRGITVGYHPDTMTPAVATINGSVVESNTDTGLFVVASSATVEDSVIRDTLTFQGDYGFGAAALSDHEGVSAQLELHGTVVERNYTAGVVVLGVAVTMDRTTIRDTLPGVFFSGRAIAIQDDPFSAVRGSGVLTHSLLERSAEIALFTWGSDLVAEAVAVRDTTVRSSDGRGGRGISVEDDVTVGQRSTATLERVRIERSREFGLLVTGADVVANGLHVIDTIGADHPELPFGDGVAVVTLTAGPATGQLTRTQVERSARAGIASFAALVGLGEGTLECNSIHLAGESVDGAPFEFNDLGGNTCGCDGQPVTCQVVSSGLRAPTPL